MKVPIKRVGLLTVLMASLVGSGGCLTYLVLEELKTNIDQQRYQAKVVNNYQELQSKVDNNVELTADEHLEYAYFLRKSDAGIVDLRLNEEDTTTLQKQHLLAAARFNNEIAYREYGQLLIFSNLDWSKKVNNSGHLNSIKDLQQFKEGLQILLASSDAYNPATDGSISTYFAYDWNSDYSNINFTLYGLLNRDYANLPDDLVKDIRLFQLFYKFNYYAYLGADNFKPEDIYQQATTPNPNDREKLLVYYAIAKLINAEDAKSKIDQDLQKIDPQLVIKAEELYANYVARFSK